MQNSERQQFEAGWKSAFDGAEMAPKESLWNSIEVDLAGSEASHMKRRVLFYQRVAAATVIFALVSGALAVYNYRVNNDELVTTTNSTSASGNQAGQGVDQSQSAESVSDPASASPNPANSHPQQPVTASRSVQPGKDAGDSDNNLQHKGSAGPPTVPPPVPVFHNDKQVAIAESIQPENKQRVDDPALVAHDDSPSATDAAAETESKETAVAELLTADQINAMAEARDKEEKQKSSNRSPWLGVGGAAGSYTPNSSVGAGGNRSAAYADASSGFAAAQSIPQSVREQVGSAYSAGVSGGLKLSRRWLVQSGINYISQRIDYTTNFVGISNTNKATAMTNEYFYNSSVADVAVTNPYEVSSNTEILSVPVQAGFLIVDRKFGWQLNTGVSTDFFLKNTLADKSGLREKISEGSGEDSPYRALNWSGLFNTELSYRIGDRYRLALVPGLRYTFQPYLKEQSSASPLILDVGFRFNYLFK